MKTLIVYIVATFFSVIVFFSCSSKKELTKADNSTEIKIPLTGKEYETNKDYFRAKQVGESPDLATAKKMAEHNAKSEMAGNIQSLIKRVTDQYINQRAIKDKKEWENKFDERSLEVVKQELNNVKIIGEKLLQKNDKTYQYWLAIEASKEAILNGIDKGVSSDAKLQLDFDKHQFEKIFNEEMEKFEKEQDAN